MRRTAAASAIIAVIVLWAAPAMVVADDVFTLPWDRTDPRTTTQVWNFDASDTLNVPADDPSTPAFDNPYDTPVANLPFGGIHNASFQGRSGVWGLTFDDTTSPGGINLISFTVPVPEDPLASITTFIQVTWHDDGAMPAIAGSPADFQGVVETVSSTLPSSDGWNITTFGFGSFPSTSPIQVTVAAPNDNPGSTTTSYIDQVIIDTLTVPAPGTATVLFVGGMIAMARRRYRRHR